MPDTFSRRKFLKGAAATVAAISAPAFTQSMPKESKQPNILYIMTDQQRFDTIESIVINHQLAFASSGIYTPNLNRLVNRGVTFTNAYSTCPVCVAARYTIRTGCNPLRTGFLSNAPAQIIEGIAPATEERCGNYLEKTLRQYGYRTFGVGKFHAMPWNENLGFETQLYAEPGYPTPERRMQDDYAAFIAKKHPDFDFIEQLQGERTEMYYAPQASALPPELGQEWWVADRAIELIHAPDLRPWYGFVSFFAPHPPLAPPIPFNRLFDPDRMPNPICGDITIDHMDALIPSMNYMIWADDLSNATTRILRARYLGEIAYVDHCIGRILDAIEARPDADNTLIAFFSDHGDHLGDHAAWQKESFFEASCHIPFLVSWPDRIRPGINDSLASLEDLCGLALCAAQENQEDMRDGSNLLKILSGEESPRETLFGYYGEAGTDSFKLMVRRHEWKYIFLANGGGELLFNLKDDPHELRQRLHDELLIAQSMRQLAIQQLKEYPLGRLCIENDDLRVFPHQDFPRMRIKQFDNSREVFDFPQHPKDVLSSWTFKS